MNKKFLICLLLFATLSACDQTTGPGLEIHDSKYVAVADDGSVLEQKPGRWNCTLDQYTGLTWEVKSDEEGLHNWRNTYSWYNPEEAHDELDYRGTANGGSCAGSDCDTFNWVNAVNEQGLCGYKDWRLPLKDELASISDPRKAGSPPTTNTDFFPYMQAGEYWSANDYSFQWDAAWLWNFQLGHDRVEWKKTPRFVRLVRGEAMQLERVKD